ncbi:apolipoprotein N-acyltransferase [Shewanella sp. KT0246]|uniref:apolipoprotein N-acyltransferase n=1 Tax=Shewanella sp. KT0246 TaxID=2815912 RepID=UPI001BBE265F|nr:apolipoprotein N-acyltransferase [Shewanella sp. KT0246]GIU47440.1 apolipoprotein N-acyltransferase [Shewanella sp. KT0246]
MVTAFAAGASTTLAFAPYVIWAFYPAAMIFVLYQSRHLTPKENFFHWLSFGFGCFAFGISWVHVSIDTFGGLPLIVSMGLMGLLALYLALYPALAGYLTAKLSQFPHFKHWHHPFQYLGLFPALWVLTEWMRGWVLTGFPWLWAGYSQTQGPISELGSVIGALGLSYLIALFCGSIVLVLKKRFISAAVITAIIIIATLITPLTSNISPRGETVRVALVQGNIEQSMKWEPDALWPTLLKYMDLSRPNFDADIVVWPEAAVPAPESMVGDFLHNTDKVANMNNSAIITGIISLQQQEFYNSLIVMGNANQPVQSHGDYQGNGTNDYKKHHLLPIGEFVPFESLLRPLAPFFNLPMSSFARGDFQQKNLNAMGYQIAPALCYEIVFPEQLRANTHADTDLLLTVSNDAWFGDSIGPLQHMEIAQMRSIELGRPLVRATNNGVTAVVDIHGRITHKIPQFQEGVLVADVPLYDGETWFKRIGQTPLLLLCGLLFLIGLTQQIILWKKGHRD